MENNLNTSDPIALSLLLTEELYVIDKPDFVELKVEDTKDEKENISQEPLINPIEIPVINNITDPKPSSKPAYEYLGENNKSFLVVINNTEKDFLAKADLEFLLKIIKAKGLVLEDIAILNKAKYKNLSFDNLKEFFAFNKMLTFGINPKEFGVVGIESNKKCNFKNTTILGTWDLSLLNSDVKKKTTFWNELKTF
jgi:hypothetical protein